MKFTDSITTRTVGFSIMALLKNYGIETIFGIPGTHNLEFYRPLTELGIRAITTRHEQGAGYAADAWSLRKNLPGVVVTTSGPGLLNALSAAGNAFCESRALIILSPGAPLGAEGTRSGVLHETKNPTAATGAIVEWSRRVESAAEATQSIHDAFKLFRTGRHRPVHIEVPLDVLESFAPVHANPLRIPEVELLPAPGDEAFTTAAAILASSPRPVILAGGGVTRASIALTEFAERLEAPVLTTTNGKGAIPETHRLSLGASTMFEAAHKLLSTADPLIVIGSKVGIAEFNGRQLDPAGRIIRVDIDPLQHGVNLPRDVEFIGDSAVVLPELLHCLQEQKRTSGEVEDVRLACEQEIATFPIKLTALAKRIVSALPRDTIVTGDSSQISYLGMAVQMQCQTPNSFITSPTYATLGYGLPAAVGAKLASPDTPVVTVLGDGALMLSIQEIMTAVEIGVDLTIVCVDNGGYGEIRDNEIERGMTPIGVDLIQPNWAALAIAFGANGRTVTALDEVGPAVLEAIGESGVSLVHVVH